MRKWGKVTPNNSFKPTPHRGVNSVLYATLHAVATPPWGGLTPALGGEKRSVVVLFAAVIHRLRLACSSDGSPARFFFGCCAMCAHMSHALRLPASEAAIGIGSYCLT